MVIEEKKTINPYKITINDLPLIVFSDHAWRFINWIIKWRTKANYNHVMIMINPGEFVSQGNHLEQISIDKYLKKGNRLKFWKIKDLIVKEHSYIRNKVIDELKRPVTETSYDWLGILGQALGIKKLNNPFLNYCSESVRYFIAFIIKDLPLNPSPKDLNEEFKKHERMEVFGYWFSD